MAVISFCLREQSLELLKVMQADDAFYRLAVTDDDERRDAAYAEALRKAGVLVHVHLAYFDAALKLRIELLKHRSLHAAWAAPCCPEVNKAGALTCFGIKIILIQMCNSHFYFSFILFLLIFLNVLARRERRDVAFARGLGELIGLSGTVTAGKDAGDRRAHITLRDDRAVFIFQPVYQL